MSKINTGSGTVTYETHHEAAASTADPISARMTSGEVAVQVAVERTPAHKIVGRRTPVRSATRLGCWKEKACYKNCNCRLEIESSRCPVTG
jgi:hypothetical protein